MAQYRVQIYWELWDDESNEERMLTAQDPVGAASEVFHELGGRCADWIRVEEQDERGQVVGFLECRLEDREMVSSASVEYGLSQRT